MIEMSPKPSEALDPSRRIDRNIYTDEGIYQAELEQIFRRAWLFVGVESELETPQSYLTTMIGSESIIVTRDGKGELKAFFNACTHRATALAVERHGSTPAFRCMYHGWTFDHEGNLTGVPYPDAYGESFDKSDFNVPQVRVESFAGLLFASIDPLVSSLTDYLGDAAPWVERYCRNDEGFEVLGRVRWRYPGNWKLWHENFADNYHPEFVHKTIGEGYRGVDASGWNYKMDSGHGLLLFPFVMQRRFDRQHAQLEKYLGREMENRQPSSNRASEERESEAPSADSPRLGRGIITVFPTLDIQSSTAASGPNPVLQVVRPESVNSSIVEAWVLCAKDSASEERHRRLQRAPGVGPADFIAADDNEACARCQVGGLASGLPYSNMDRGQIPGNQGDKRDEYSLRSFHEGWRTYMG